MIHERVAVVAMIEVDDDLCIYTVTHTKGEYYTCTIPREKRYENHPWYSAALLYNVYKTKVWDSGLGGV